MPLEKLGLVEEVLHLPSLGMSFEFEGEWWVPSNPEKMLHGVLRFEHSKRILLELSGTFLDDSRQYMLSGRHDIIPLIHGNAKCNPWTPEAVTVIGAQFVSGGMVLGTVSCKYEIDMFLIGEYYFDMRSMLFSDFYSSFCGFEEWIGDERLSINETRDADTYYCLTYRGSQTIEADAPSVDALIEVTDVVEFTGGTRVVEAGIKRRSFLKISRQSHSSIREYLRIVYQIGRFLTLMKGSAIYPDRILALAGSGLRRMGFRSLIAIYCQTPITPIQAANSTPLIWPIVKFIDIRQEISKYLNRWFEISHNLEPCLDLYFRELCDENPRPSVQLLALTQALEAYHRRSFSGTYLNEERFESIRTTLVEALPTDIPRSFRDSICSRLRYANELSQRKRIDEVINKMKDKVPKDAIRKNLSQEAVAIRNDFTHYSDERKDSRYSDEEIMTINAELFFVITITFLNELGICNEALEESAKVLQHVVSIRKYAAEMAAESAKVMDG